LYRGGTSPATDPPARPSRGSLVLIHEAAGHPPLAAPREGALETPLRAKVENWRETLKAEHPGGGRSILYLLDEHEVERKGSRPTVIRVEDTTRTE